MKDRFLLVVIVLALTAAGIVLASLLGISLNS